ncbi:hypothetical protein [Limosilactobacillus fermentum]|nr:hypothetical protein [Limosilactobacillus fermentum]
MNIKRVRRIMRKHGIKADVRQKKRSRKKGLCPYNWCKF